MMQYNLALYQQSEDLLLDAGDGFAGIELFGELFENSKFVFGVI